MVTVIILLMSEKVHEVFVTVVFPCGMRIYVFIGLWYTERQK